MNGKKSVKKGKYWKKKWEENFNKKNTKIKNDFKSTYVNSDLKKFRKFNTKEKAKYFESKPSLATRQCSMASIEIISTIIPQLIGGSADLEWF